jgi:hypothetical protein
MSVFADLGAYNREEDWIVSLICLLIVFLVIYPLFIFYIRYRHMRRIKKQMVTSIYKLPISMSPVEVAYIFSAKVKRQQMYATLLDLANRSVLILHQRADKTTVEIGPKLESDLKQYEELLLKQINNKSVAIDSEAVLSGFTRYEVNKKNKIEGSRQYVFWWLLRDSLRSRHIIEKHLSKKFTSMLLVYGVVGSLAVSVLSIALIRFQQMASAGEVDLNRIVLSIESGVTLWLIMLLPMIIISFGVLKYKGRMLGREWIMTQKYQRYLGQIDAFREFVRLTHKDKLKFESVELKKESIAHTRPYAIACGYIKK